MLKFLTAGESHGPGLTAILDGFPAGFPLDIESINRQLTRRQKGYGRGDRMKIESDKVEITSGLRHGLTLGSPITLHIINKDFDNWTEAMSVAPLPDDENIDLRQVTQPRPGHADLSGGIKTGFKDLRNILERASARETTARVALGAVARQLMESFDIEFFSHVVQIGKVRFDNNQPLEDLKKLSRQVEQSPVRCLDKATTENMMKAIDKARADNNTLGGVVEVVVRGLPVGLGSYRQASERLGSKLAAAMMSVPSVKGFEIGLGFGAAELPGSEVHDEIFYDAQGDPRRKKFFRKTNRAGGLEGGMTNGEDVVFRVASKPLSTLKQPLRTVDVVTKQPVEATVERTDTCVVPVLTVICENIAAMVLAEAFLEKFGSDSFNEIKQRFQLYLDTPY